MDEKEKQKDNFKKIPQVNKTNLSVMEYANIALAIVSIATFFLLYYLTNKQINLSQNSAKIELRAYIQVVNVIPTQMEIGKTLELTLFYKNTGQTPAYNIGIQTRIKPGGQPKTITDSDWEELKKLPVRGNNVLGSKSTMDFTMQTDLIIKDSTTIPAWKSTGKYLGVFGYIYYTDIFDSTTHFSQFYLQFWRDKIIFAPSYNKADRYENLN